jgi:hypothetical protein
VAKPDLADYVPVAVRLQQFRDKYPQGSLQPWDAARPYEIEEVGNERLIVVVAAAYREPGDPRPGVGMASEPYPGKTPYTKGSELMNAETSAWGRAIVAVLAADTTLSIASQEEVRNRQEEPVSRKIIEGTIKVRTPNRENGENPDFVKNARNAKTVDELRSVWKAAGAAGALKTEIANPDGEKMTLQEYFTARAEEIGFEVAHQTLKDAEMV